MHESCASSRTPLRLDPLECPVEIVTPPASEPLSLAEAKAHLRVDSNAEDSYIAALIAAARASIEHETGRALVTQTLRVRLDRVPYFDRELRIPRAPLAGVSAFTYIDTAGATQTFDAANYTVDTVSTPGRIVLVEGASWPADVARQPGAVRIQYTAGCAPGAVDPRAVHAIRFIIAWWYAQREAVNVGNIVNILPRAADHLVWQLKVF